MHQAKHVLKNWVKAIAGLALGAAVALPAFAQSKGLDEPFREGYKKALAGKKTCNQQDQDNNKILL